MHVCVSGCGGQNQPKEKDIKVEFTVEFILPFMYVCMYVCLGAMVIVSQEMRSPR
jgi:hypothetical protein